MGNATSQNPSQTLEILIQGEALANINSGQVLAKGNSWHPIRVLDTPVPSIAPVERTLRRPGVLNWMRSRLQDQAAEPPLQGEAVIPISLAAQVRSLRAQMLLSVMKVAWHNVCSLVPFPFTLLDWNMLSDILL